MSESNRSSKKRLRRMSPYINGTAYCGMLLENPDKPQHFGPDLADGCGPYYESRDVDAEIERLTAELAKANADFRELLLTNGRVAERNLNLSAERDRLRGALQNIVDSYGPSGYGSWDFVGIACNALEIPHPPVIPGQADDLVTLNKRLRAALERITECTELRDGGEGIQVIAGSGREFWYAVKAAREITHRQPVETTGK